MKPVNSTIAMILAAMLIPFGLITVLTDAPTPLKVAGILAAEAATLVGSRSANGFWNRNSVKTHCRRGLRALAELLGEEP